mmetsp:Transcript_112254/g.194922  ORF Transcript_112254/g.194922 Transcript_112254/m.194922 type:complete len:307 (-) Transcript_112254:3109-4029(-)
MICAISCLCSSANRRSLPAALASSTALRRRVCTSFRSSSSLCFTSASESISAVHLACKARSSYHCASMARCFCSNSLLSMLTCSSIASTSVRFASTPFFSSRYLFVSSSRLAFRRVRSSLSLATAAQMSSSSFRRAAIRSSIRSWSFCSWMVARWSSSSWTCSLLCRSRAARRSSSYTRRSSSHSRRSLRNSAMSWCRSRALESIAMVLPWYADARAFSSSSLDSSGGIISSTFRAALNSIFCCSKAMRSSVSWLRSFSSMAHMVLYSFSSSFSCCTNTQFRCSTSVLSTSGAGLAPLAGDLGCDF